jgi:hypothetical protein
MNAIETQLEHNKRVTVAFYEKALFHGEVDEALALYASETYTRHTPLAADGKDGLRQYIKWIAANCLNPKGRSSDDVPVTYALFSDEGHGFGRPVNAICFPGLEEGFLAVHLGGREEALGPDTIAASSVRLVGPTDRPIRAPA